MESRVYLHAISMLTQGKIGALQQIEEQFQGDWERAWHSDIAKYIPRMVNAEGHLYTPKINELKSAIHPAKEYELLSRLGIDIITRYDNNYPQSLTHIANPPFLLYVRGNPNAWQRECLSIVGTRRASTYGKSVTDMLVRDLTSSNLGIVSGLAMGIDTAAHESALTYNLPTVAVLGSGLSDGALFPAPNVHLAHRIIDAGGALVSEYAPRMHGTKFTFPQRNRIISGMSKGTLVIEADIKSGSLITAREAIDQNRDVFAVPGNIFQRGTAGTHQLLKQGAKLVHCAQDILQEYEILVSTAAVSHSTLTPDEQSIIDTLSKEPLTIDEIIRRTNLSPNVAATTLVMLELQQKVRNAGNNIYSL